MTRVLETVDLDRFWVALVEVPDSELRELLPRAERWRSEVVESVCGGDEELCTGADIRIGSVEDYAAALAASEAMNRFCEEVGGCPIPRFDLAPGEEEGYGLPPFSVYYGPDARSWSGRWTWSAGGEDVDEAGLCFALAPEPWCSRIAETLEQLLEKHELPRFTEVGRGGRHWVLVVVEKRR